MKLMRKIFLPIVAGLFFTNGYGQNITYGAEAGINLSGAHAVEPGVVFHGSPGIGFALGGFADIPLEGTPLSIRPKLYFSRERYTPILFGDKTPFALSYINIPIPVIYHSTLAD